MTPNEVGRTEEMVPVGGDSADLIVNMLLAAEFDELIPSPSAVNVTL